LKASEARHVFGSTILVSKLRVVQGAKDFTFGFRDRFLAIMGLGTKRRAPPTPFKEV